MDGHMKLLRTTETNVALDMSGTSFGGGDSPFVRFGFAVAPLAAESEVSSPLLK